MLGCRVDDSLAGVNQGISGFEGRQWAGDDLVLRGHPRSVSPQMDPFLRESPTWPSAPSA